jgi:hypothetical protein
MRITRVGKTRLPASERARDELGRYKWHTGGGFFSKLKKNLAHCLCTGLTLKRYPVHSMSLPD